MSSLIGMNGNNPIMHLTTDQKTVSQLKGQAGSTTTFHSDLPYILVKKQFELASYSTWASSGRRFTLSSALKSYRSANPDSAYLLVLEDSSGSKWVHSPTLSVRASWYRYYSGGWTTNEIGACLVGGDYQTAYTASDSELSSLTQNTIYGNYTWTFRTWDSNDDYVTVFKTPLTRHVQSHQMFIHHGYPNVGHNNSVLEYMTQPYVQGGTNIESSGNDVVKVTFVFLNITHTSSTFDRQSGFANNYIRIKPDEFKVNDIDLAGVTPIISHGVKNSGASVTPSRSGLMVCGKVNGTNITSGKMTSSNQVSGGTCPALEIPVTPPSLTGWDINLKTRIFKRNGVIVFDDSSASLGLFVTGTREINFNPSMTLTSSTVDAAITTTQSGSLGSVNSNTVFFASVVSGGSKLHSTQVMAVGDNLIADLAVGHYNSSASSRWSNSIKLYLRISSTGAVTVRKNSFAGNNVSQQGQVYQNSYYGTSSVSLTIPEFKVRLIALNTL